MSADKKQKTDRLYRLLRQSCANAGAIDEQAFNDLKVYAGVDLDELRVYMEQQLAEERRLSAQPKVQEPAVSPFARVSDSQLRQIIETVRGKIALGAKLELARRDFFEFCHLLAPSFYRRDRPFLVRLCKELQAFYESDELVMLVNLPPRHGKSRTAGLFAMWIFGKRPEAKIMTGSYNEILSTTFSKTVRGGIAESKAEADKLVYGDIFPDTRIKQGDAAMKLWSLDGQYASYLATSPDGTATGFGASLIIIDDLIKSAMEAFNDGLLEGQWKWFADTMLSRLESGGKIIIIMTRWASGDLAGRAKESFEEQGIPVRALVMKAVQEDGSMLCPQILSRADYDMKTHTMSEEIASANYQQIPVDIKGKLYSSFKTYAAIPIDERGREICSGTYNYTDTADEGADFLCSIDFKDVAGKAYIMISELCEGGEQKLLQTAECRGAFA